MTTATDSEKTPRNADDMLRDALDLIRQAYWHHVRDIAHEAMQNAGDGDFGKPGEDSDDHIREKFDEWLWESIDGDGWVIYTQKAQAVCLVSDNDGAYADEYGEDGIVENGALAWSRLAFAALRADVIERLGIEGFNVNNPAEWIRAQTDNA